MTKLPSGSWRLRVLAGYDAVSGNPRQVSKTVRGTKKEAESALRHFVSEVEYGTAPLDGSTSLDAFLERWLAHLAPNREPSTIRGYQSKVHKISAKLGRTRVDRLTPQMLDRAYREWQDEGLSSSSVHHLHRVLAAAMHQAVKWGIISRAPTDNATPPSSRTKVREAPTPDVIRRLVAAADKGQPVLSAAIAIAATTGLRRGELCGLRWSDVDGETLHVRRSIKHALDGTWVVGEPKTHRRRRMALDPFTLAVVAQHRHRAEGWASDAGVKLSPDGYLLTIDPTGVEPWKPDSLGQQFHRLCNSLPCEACARDGSACEVCAGTGKVSVPVHLHGLRHFAATMLIAGGVDVRTVAGRLGHADATTTLRVYSHLIESRDQHAARLLGNLMSGDASAERLPIPTQ